MRCLAGSADLAVACSAATSFLIGSAIHCHVRIFGFLVDIVSVLHVVFAFDNLVGIVGLIVVPADPTVAFAAQIVVPGLISIRHHEIGVREHLCFLFPMTSTAVAEFVGIHQTPSLYLPLHCLDWNFHVDGVSWYERIPDQDSAGYHPNCHQLFVVMLADL